MTLDATLEPMCVPLDVPQLDLGVPKANLGLYRRTGFRKKKERKCPELCSPATGDWSTVLAVATIHGGQFLRRFYTFRARIDVQSSRCPQAAAAL
jgi:hypothetical protein